MNAILLFIKSISVSYQIFVNCKHVTASSSQCVVAVFKTLGLMYKVGRFVMADVTSSGLAPFEDYIDRSQAPRLLLTHPPSPTHIVTTLLLSTDTSGLESAAGASSVRCIKLRIRRLRDATHPNMSGDRIQ